MMCVSDGLAGGGLTRDSPTSLCLPSTTAPFWQGNIILHHHSNVARPRFMNLDTTANKSRCPSLVLKSSSAGLADGSFPVRLPIANLNSRGSQPDGGVDRYDSQSFNPSPVYFPWDQTGTEWERQQLPRRDQTGTYVNPWDLSY
ncbi:hypothetical protein OROMI_005236 [Orobanche minor]